MGFVGFFIKVILHIPVDAIALKDTGNIVLEFCLELTNSLALIPNIGSDEVIKERVVFEDTKLTFDVPTGEPIDVTETPYFANV